MNAATFKSLLKPEMGTNNVKDTDHAAQILADAYDLANIGTSCTFFGSTVMSGDKSTLKSMLKTGFDINKMTNTKNGFIIMATGFCSYWLTATFTPLPTLPPCIAPLKGTTVLFPGNPDELEKDLKMAFNQPDFDSFVNFLYNSLVSHHTTIAGTYNGNVPALPSPIPAILPWVGIISAPLPNSGSVSAGTNGTGGNTGGDTGGSSTGGTASTGGSTGGNTGGTGATGGNTGGNTNGTGATGGNTDGSTGGNTDGNTGGTGATGGNTGGSTGGNTDGSTGGSTGGNTGGSTGGNNGGSTGGGNMGMGGFNLNGVPDRTIISELLNIVILVNNRFSPDLVIGSAIGINGFTPPVPIAVKNEVAFNPNFLKKWGIFSDQERQRLGYIFDYMIEEGNLEIDSQTGLVKVGPNPPF